MPATGFSAGEVDTIRADFPVLSRRVNDRPLVYLDSAATTQRPVQVLDAERSFAEARYAAVHRGAHTLAGEATDAFEAARERVAGFVGMPAEALVWTKNATEALNLLAFSLSFPGPRQLGPGDEIVTTEQEHHANLVPWQETCARTGATLKYVPLGDDGRLDLNDLGSIITSRTKVVAFSHVSNVLATVTPVAELVAAARAVGALTVLDACQSVPHLPVAVPDLGVDAIAFSGHKMLGPTGVGALVARPELLSELPPVLTGGSMVEVVTLDGTTYREPPQRFEAGTQPVAQAVALAAAVDYLEKTGMERVHAHELHLGARLLDGVRSVPGVRVLGPSDPADAQDRIGTVAFAVDGVHPHDVGQVLDDAGVAVRVGHHCAQPVHRRYGVTASTRASAYLYTTEAEVQAFVDALRTVRPFFGLGEV